MTNSNKIRLIFKNKSIEKIRPSLSKNMKVGFLNFDSICKET